MIRKGYGDVRESNYLNMKDLSAFLGSHRLMEASIQKTLYGWYLDSELYGQELWALGEEAGEEEQEVRQTEDPAALLKLMRRRMRNRSVLLLRDKVLEKEAEMLPLIESRILRSGNSVFSENALDFFMRAKENASSWIVGHYDEVRNEYTRSLLCLFLGFRGTQGLLSDLCLEAERMARLYPGESYDQGPALAVREMILRFYRPDGEK
jgi:hypothetical protein